MGKTAEGNYLAEGDHLKDKSVRKGSLLGDSRYRNASTNKTCPERVLIVAEGSAHDVGCSE